MPFTQASKWICHSIASRNVRKDTLSAEAFRSESCHHGHVNASLWRGVAARAGTRSVKYLTSRVNTESPCLPRPRCLRAHCESRPKWLAPTALASGLGSPVRDFAGLISNRSEHFGLRGLSTSIKKVSKAHVRTHSFFCSAHVGERGLACGAASVGREGWHDGEGDLFDGDGSGSMDIMDAFDSSDGLFDKSPVDVDALEAGALRAIHQAERQCRQAAQQLLEAQTRLESARLAAAELRAMAGKGSPSPESDSREDPPGKCVEVEATAVHDVIALEPDDDDTWRDGVNAVEAVIRAEEQRRARLEAFQRATDVLRQRLTEAPMQATINDRHIEFLDRGGQYHVASWVINEVEGYWSKESGEYGLAVNINLDLALQGCDPQTAHFLQELPFDQVLGIKASPQRSTPVLVDYWDGSSWETDSHEGWAGAEAGSGADVVWGTVSDQGWSLSEKGSLESKAFGATEVEFDMACPIDVDYASKSYSSSVESPPSSRVVLEFRDGTIFRTEEDVTLVDSSKLQLPGTTPTSVVALPAAKSTSLARLKAPKSQPLFRMQEAVACLGVCAYLATMMVKTCELSTLLTDAYVLLVACGIGLTMACAVGVIRPSLPPALLNLLGMGASSGRSRWHANEQAPQTSRPWDQVVFWMGMGAAVLSAATISAIVVKALQAGSSFVYQAVAQLVSPVVASGALSLEIPRQVAGYVGYMTASSFIAESIPYLASALAWMLLVFSVAVASASVSLILISFTGRRPPPQLGSQNDAAS